LCHRDFRALVVDIIKKEKSEGQRNKKGGLLAALKEGKQMKFGV
jgi:hypothetical protein